MVGWVFFYTENSICFDLLVLSKNLKIANSILKLNYLRLCKIGSWWVVLFDTRLFEFLIYNLFVGSKN